MSTTKRCPRCGRELPTEEFYSNRRNKDGLSNYCKEYTKTVNKMYENEKKLKSMDAEVRKMVEDTFPDKSSTAKSAERVITTNTLSEVTTVELVKELRSCNVPILVNYTPVDLMQRLAKYGYVGKLIYYERKEIDLSKFESDVKQLSV